MRFLSADPGGLLSLHMGSRSVLDSLGQVCGLDVLCTGQVGDGASQFQHPTGSPRACLQLLHRRSQHTLSSLIYAAVFPHFGWPHVRIAG